MILKYLIVSRMAKVYDIYIFLLGSNEKSKDDNTNIYFLQMGVDKPINCWYLYISMLFFDK